jgi:hypothetical protein
MANRPALGLDTPEPTTYTDIVSTVSRLRGAVDDYNRMHEMMKTASPVIARHIAEDMRIQRRIIETLCDEMKEALDG